MRWTRLPWITGLCFLCVTPACVLQTESVKGLDANQWEDVEDGISYADGNVGIGTVRPIALLTVSESSSTAGEAQYRGLIQITSDGDPSLGDAGLELKASGESGGSGFRIIAPDVGGGAASLVVQSRASSATWSNVFGITHDGRVGVGTPTPATTLDVVGTTSAVGYYLTNGAFIGESTPEDVSLFAGGVARLSALAVGTVLIPDSTAPVDLQVDGAASAASLFVSGACTANCVSDARLKRDIRPLGEALERLLRLRGVTFEWNDPTAHGERERGVQTGFVAQQVEEVFPEWVREGDDGYKRLLIRGFEALSVEAMRSLAHRTDDLSARVTDLAAANDRLTAANDRLAADLASERQARTRLEARLAALEAAFESALPKARAAR